MMKGTPILNSKRTWWRPSWVGKSSLSPGTVAASLRVPASLPPLHHLSKAAVNELSSCAGAWVGAGAGARCTGHCTLGAGVVAGWLFHQFTVDCVVVVRWLPGNVPLSFSVWITTSTISGSVEKAYAKACFIKPLKFPFESLRKWYARLKSNTSFGNFNCFGEPSEQPGNMPWQRPAWHNIPSLPPKASVASSPGFIAAILRKPVVSSGCSSKPPIIGNPFGTLMLSTFPRISIPRPKSK
mmetsp:Transcript_31611/g.79812  ORF Transcript_31611/g.79812 Transcript_31611/m.79812 type:complete len:240 (-) Transcript_31611:2964-3683(-)